MLALLSPIADGLFLLAEMHRLKAEPAPGRGALRIVAFNSPGLRSEKRPEDQVLAGPAILAAFVLVLLRGL